MRGKKSFIHRAQFRQYGEKDLIDKFKIIKILKDKFGLHGLTGEMIQIDKDSHRCPDILIKNGREMIVIELDGEVHGSGDGITKRKKDVKRDNDYQAARVREIILNKESTNGYEENLVMDSLVRQGLKPLY